VEGLAAGPVAFVDDGDLTAVPDGAVLAVPSDFVGEFAGDPTRLGALLDSHEGVTSYAAIVARELDLPMIADVELPTDLTAGSKVTVDAERGIVYEDAIGEDRGAA